MKQTVPWPDNAFYPSCSKVRGLVWGELKRAIAEYFPIAVDF